MEETRHHEANERMWQINAAAFSKMSDQGRNAVMAGVRELEQFRFTPKQSLFDRVGDKVRMRMIGVNLKVGGDRWLVEHPRQATWMKGQGVSEQQCIDAHTEWIEKQKQNPKFEVARNVKRTDHVRKITDNYRAKRATR